jgi:hypothetical protein
MRGSGPGVGSDGRRRGRRRGRGRGSGRGTSCASGHAPSHRLGVGHGSGGTRRHGRCRCRCRCSRLARHGRDGARRHGRRRRRCTARHGGGRTRRHGRCRRPCTARHGRRGTGRHGRCRQPGPAGQGQDEAPPGNHSGDQVGNRVGLNRVPVHGGDHQLFERTWHDLVYPGQRLLAGQFPGSVGRADRAPNRAAQEHDSALGDGCHDPETGDVPRHVAENPARQPGGDGGRRQALRREFGNQADQIPDGIVADFVTRACAARNYGDCVAEPTDQTAPRRDAHPHGHLFRENAPVLAGLCLMALCLMALCLTTLCLEALRLVFVLLCSAILPHRIPVSAHSAF